MELQDSVLKEFADAVNNNSLVQPSDSQHLYATVSRNIEGTSDLVYVKLNGSEIDTPARSLVKVGIGDVVMCAMRGHTLTIIGNVSYPALTRIENVYMTLTAEGLMIGRLNSENKPYESYIVVGPSSSNIYNIDSVGKGILVASFGETVQVGRASAPHVVITSTGFEIRNGSNKVLANFTSNGIQLNDSTGATIAEFGTSTIAIGKSTSATITFCGGKAVISLDSNSGTLKIAGGNSVEAIGISNTYNNRYRSEVVCEAKNNSPKASIQLLNGNNVITSLLLSTDGVNVNVPSQKALTVSKDNGTGHEVVTVNDIVMYGDIIFRPSSGEATRITCSANPNIPNGYTLIGLSEILTNYTTYWGVDYLNVNPSNNLIEFQVGSKDGTAKPKPGEIYCRWFAIRTSGIKYDGQTVIDM